MSRAPVFKGGGYVISTVSVLLLGVTSWKSASEHPLLLACLLAGMALSIVGMGCRWISFHLQRKDEGEDARK